MRRIFDLRDIKHEIISLSIILMSCVILFTSCSSAGYKSRVEKTLVDNKGTFDNIAEYMLSQSETIDNKRMEINGEEFLNGDKSLVLDYSLHSIIHGEDDPYGLGDLCCIPIEDEQILNDMQSLFENLEYEDVCLRESKWKNDIEIIFTKLLGNEKWECYVYHTATFPPEAKEGYSIRADYSKRGELEYVGNSLYLGDSWYYSYGDIVS